MINVYYSVYVGGIGRILSDSPELQQSLKQLELYDYSDEMKLLLRNVLQAIG